MQPVLYCFAAVCVLACGVVWAFVPETKGVELEDIADAGTRLESDRKSK
jgi:hypothetical protein